jgi:hypothetical protein
MSFWYLATPYSKFPGGHDAAWKAATQETGLLIRAGLIVFSPITHSHPLVVHGGVSGTDFAAWEHIDLAMIHASRGLIACRLPSWEISPGMVKEIEYAEKIGKIVVTMQPGEVPREFVGGP